MKKTCHECKKLKFLKEFHKQSKSRDGRMTKCKDCKNLYDKNYYQIVREKRINQSEIWNLINRKGKNIFVMKRLKN